MRRWLAAVLGIAVLSACSSPQPPQPSTAAPLPTSSEMARELAASISADALVGHLRKLAEIAAANNGTRAENTKGFDGSVDYVVNALREKGFDVTTPEFTRVAVQRNGTQTLTIANRPFPLEQASVLRQTPPGGLSAPQVRPTKAAGCAPGDYAGLPARGAIAVVDDTACSVVDKQNAAVANGAVAVVMIAADKASRGRGDLFPAGYYDRLTVPVGVGNPELDKALRRTRAPVRLTLESTAAKVTSRNVIAQTKTGDSRNVVMVGAHLDSVPAGPGINDNGSGVAAVLETALQLGASPTVTNAVRFAFWGAEEVGLYGSGNYVRGLSRDALDDIALYFNVDVIGSPNAGYFTYDGDQSGQVNPDVPVNSVPVGSAGIERTLAGYLNFAGRRPADQPLGVTTDYSPFLRAGVPIGGLTTGFTGMKTELQARLWGGRPGVAFDPNYHTAKDGIDNIDRDALAVMAATLAFGVGTYANSLSGPNGVPPRP